MEFLGTTSFNAWTTAPVLAGLGKCSANASLAGSFDRGHTEPIENARRHWHSAVLAVILIYPVHVSAQTNPAPTAAADIAANPEVTAAERLFSAWLESQIVCFGIPGVSVGVVFDQQLDWSKGFGYSAVLAAGVSPKPKKGALTTGLALPFRFSHQHKCLCGVMVDC